MRNILSAAVICLGLLLISTAANAATTCYWVGGTGNWSDGANHWSSTSGGSIGTCAAAGGYPHNSSDIAILNASSGGGIVTFDTTVNLGTTGTITASAFTGTLGNSTDAQTLTMTSFIDTGTGGTQTFHMGANTWNFDGAAGGTAFDVSNSNMTFDTDTSIINFQATGNIAGTTLGTSRTFNQINVLSGSASISGTTPTITTFGGAAGATAQFGGGQTTTITNALSTGGTSSQQFGLMSANNAGSSTALHISASGGTLQWTAFYHVTCNTNTLTITNSFDLGSNSNCGTITPPSVGGGGGHILGNGL